MINPNCWPCLEVYDGVACRRRVSFLMRFLKLDDGGNKIKWPQDRRAEENLWKIEREREKEREKEKERKRVRSENEYKYVILVLRIHV